MLEVPESLLRTTVGRTEFLTSKPLHSVLFLPFRTILPQVLLLPQCLLNAWDHPPDANSALLVPQVSFRFLNSCAKQLDFLPAFPNGLLEDLHLHPEGGVATQGPRGLTGLKTESGIGGVEGMQTP